MIVGHSLSASTTTSTWYIDSGASSHMTCIRDVFTKMTQTGLDLEVVLGDDTMVREVGCGTVLFDRDSMEPMLLKDDLYVLGMKKNLVSVSTIEDRGLGVYVLDGKVYIFPKAKDPSASYAIGVRCGKLYNILFQPHHALAHAQSSNELCELWHKRMAHLHHQALRMLRDMTTGWYISTQSKVVYAEGVL